jgi:hypothetical protein
MYKHKSGRARTLPGAAEEQPPEADAGVAGARVPEGTAGEPDAEPGAKEVFLAEEEVAPGLPKPRARRRAAARRANRLMF